MYRPFGKRENVLYSDPVYLLSEWDKVRCYFPTPFRFPLGEHESLQFVHDGKVYLENWVEEGWDDAQDRRDRRFPHVFRNGRARRFGSGALARGGRALSIRGGHGWTA